MEFEKRTVIGVEGWLKCGAFEMVAAVGVGVNVPEKSMPRACAVLCQIETMSGFWVCRVGTGFQWYAVDMNP